MTETLSPAKRWPDADELSAEQTALATLRAEIDLIDDQILELFEKRLALASRVGEAKDAPNGPHTKLRPDREQAVLARMTARCEPRNREAVSHLWREIIGWGLERQGRLHVRVWAPVDPAKAMDGARQRFGAAADIRIVHDSRTALAFAAEKRGVAVLAVNADDPWWTTLGRDWPGLSVFDGVGGDTPTALVLGPIDPPALPSGRRVVVTAGGDAGDGAGARRWGLNTHHGWSLSLSDAPLTPGVDEGCIGAIAQ